MNKLLILIIIGMLAYWGWEHQTKVVAWWGHAKSSVAGKSEDPENVPAMADDIPSPPVPGTAGMVIPPSIQKAVPKVVVLSEDVYYTRERLTERTDRGVRSIGAGQQVKRVSGTSGKVSVQSDTATLETDLSKLTRDPEEIKKLTGTTVVLASSATSGTAAETSELPTEAKTPAAPAGPISSLNAELNSMDKQMDRIQSKLRRVDTQ